MIGDRPPLEGKGLIDDKANRDVFRIPKFTVERHCFAPVSFAKRSPRCPIAMLHMSGIVSGPDGWVSPLGDSTRIIVKGLSKKQAAFVTISDKRSGALSFSAFSHQLYQRLTILDYGALPHNRIPCLSDVKDIRLLLGHVVPSEMTDRKSNTSSAKKRSQ